MSGCRGREGPAPAARRGLRRSWLVLLWWLTGPAWALPPLVLDGAPHHRVGGHIELLLDRSGTLSLPEVARRRDLFEPAASSAPGVGYHTGTLWVRFTVRNDTDRPVARWLSLGWPFQASVQLFVLGPEGVELSLVGGAAVPIAQRPLPSRQPLFPVELDAGQQRELLLAISGRAATMMDLELWEPAHYADTLQRRATVKFLALGATFMVVAFCALAWRVRRQPGLLLGGLGHGLLVVLFLLLDGQGGDLLPAGLGLWQSRVTNSLTFLVAACNMGFVVAFLDIRQRVPWLARLLEAAGWLALALAPVPLMVLMPAQASVVSTAYLVLLTAVAVGMARQGGTPGRTYLASWGLFWLVALVRNGQLLGLLPQLPFVVELPAVGLVFSSLALSYALYANVRQIGERAEAVQRTLLERERTEQQRLRAAVDDKTRELKTAIARAEQASSAKTAFLSMMSHELRAPLHTVLGYTRLLRRDAQGTLRMRLDLIERSGEQLLQRIERILRFSRGETTGEQAEPGPVALQPLLEQLVEDSRPLAARQSNRLQLQLDGPLPACVEADGPRLLQVLQNLVGNACKYASQALVEVCVHTDAAVTDATGTRHRVVFEVRDNGPGIPPSQQADIFEPFHRLPRHAHQPGVGLGLPIVRQLVRAMGGEVRLCSRPGEGSRFFFELWLRELPAHWLQPCGPAGEHPGPCGYAGRRRRLLIVDDSADNLAMLHDLCGRWGFEVACAAGGAEALAAMASSDLPVDAVLVDQFMPGMDGWALLRALREDAQGAALPVLLLSASAPHPPPHWPAPLRFDAVLTKPFTPVALAQALGRLLDLSWRYEAVATAPPRCPPREALAPLADMLALGQVVAVDRWCAAQEQAHPEWAAFLGGLRQLCAALDLPGLQRELARAGVAPTPARVD